MQGKVKVQESWKHVDTMHLKDSETWREIESAHVYENNEWQRWYPQRVFAATESGINSSKTMYSTDGVSWELGDTISGTSTALTYGEKTFACIDANGRRLIFTSKDGRSWNQIPYSSTIAASGAGYQMAYGLGVTASSPTFVAAIFGPQVIVSADDGATWQTIDLPSTETGWATIAYTNGIFMLYRNRPVAGQNQILLSYDGGYTWTFGNSAWPNYGSYLAAGGGWFIQTGNYSGSTLFCSRSQDGLSWQRVDMPGTAEVEYWRKTVYVSGKFFSFGYFWSESKLAVSSDHGATWQLVNLPVAGIWRDIVAGPDKILLMSSTQILYSVDDGQTWEILSTPLPGSWLELAHG